MNTWYARQTYKTANKNKSAVGGSIITTISHTKKNKEKRTCVTEISLIDNPSQTHATPSTHKTNEIFRYEINRYILSIILLCLCLRLMMHPPCRIIDSDNAQSSGKECVRGLHTYSRFFGKGVWVYRETSWVHKAAVFDELISLAKTQEGKETKTA